MVFVKQTVWAVALLFLTLTAPVVARQSTLNMTCAQAISLVRAHGAVVLSTGQHTYDRFVSSPRYCATAEYAYRGYAPTRDGRCRVGLVCKPHPPLWLDDDDDGFPFR